MAKPVPSERYILGIVAERLTDLRWSAERQSRFKGLLGSCQGPHEGATLKPAVINAPPRQVVVGPIELVIPAVQISHHQTVIMKSSDSEISSSEHPPCNHKEQSQRWPCDAQYIIHQTLHEPYSHPLLLSVPSLPSTRPSFRTLYKNPRDS